MIDLLFLTTSLALIAYGIYKWATSNDDYFTKLKIAHLKPKVLLGNTGAFFMSQYRPNEFFEYLYKSFPNEKVFGLFDFGRPMLMVRDPEMIRQMTIKDFDHFEDHRFFIDDSMDRLFGNSLIMLQGEKWRDMRATLSPAFTGSKMRQMFELVGDCAYDMCEHFKKQALAGVSLNPEIKDLFSKYTNDVIATAAFGISVNSFTNEKNEFFVMAKKMFGTNNFIAGLKILLMKTVPWLMRLFDVQFINSAVAKFLKSLVLDTIKFRVKENIFRPDMINLLMQVKQGGTEHQAINTVRTERNDDGFATVEESSIGKATVKRTWNDDEIVAQCFLFFAAGFDTSSTLLSFATYELAKNPDVQDNLYAEISEVNERLQGKRVPYDELQKMKYLDKVISEALRMWPPALNTDRVCVKDYNYNDGTNKFVIEKGTNFWIPIYPLHRDANYFPNPEKFDPERFSDENKNSILPGTYLPFGIGPRNCIGSRFALMEVKAVIYYLLLNFKFEPNAKTPSTIVLKKNPGGIIVENGIHMHLKMR